MNDFRFDPETYPSGTKVPYQHRIKGIVEMGTFLVVVGLLLLVILSLLSYLQYRDGTLNPCRMAEKKLVALLTEPYSGTAKEPNLLEPVALVLARKRINHFVEKESQAECALMLYHLWRNPQEIEKQVRELTK